MRAAVICSPGMSRFTIDLLFFWKFTEISNYIIEDSFTGGYHEEDKPVQVADILVITYTHPFHRGFSVYS